MIFIFKIYIQKNALPAYALGARKKKDMSLSRVIDNGTKGEKLRWGEAKIIESVVREVMYIYIYNMYVNLWEKRVNHSGDIKVLFFYPRFLILVEIVLGGEICVKIQVVRIRLRYLKKVITNKDWAT